MSLMVPKYYTNDPETERLLADGSLLRNGMEILTESSHMRVDIDKNDLKPWEMDRALKRNRWFTISDVSWGVKDNVDIVAFTATYPDGSQIRESWAVSYSWYVKKASESDIPGILKRALVTQKVAETLGEGMRILVNSEKSDDAKAQMVSELVEATVSELLDLL